MFFKRRKDKDKEHKEIDDTFRLVEGKSFPEALGINRSKKWMENLYDKLRVFEEENSDILSIIASNFAEHEFGNKQAFVALLPIIGEITMKMGRLFFHLGYLKGNMDQEDKIVLDNLDNMMENK